MGCVVNWTSKFIFGLYRFPGLCSYCELHRHYGITYASVFNSPLLRDEKAQCGEFS